MSLFSDYERMTHSVWRSIFCCCHCCCCAVWAFVAIILFYDIQCSNTKRRCPNPKQLHFSQIFLRIMKMTFFCYWNMTKPIWLRNVLPNFNNIDLNSMLKFQLENTQRTNYELILTTLLFNLKLIFNTQKAVDPNIQSKYLYWKIVLILFVLRTFETRRLYWTLA